MNNRKLIRLGNVAKGYREYALANVIFALLANRFLESEEIGPVRSGLTYEIETEEPHRNGAMIQPLVYDLLVVYDTTVPRSGRTYYLNIPAPLLNKHIWDRIVPDAHVSKKVRHARKHSDEGEKSTGKKKSTRSAQPTHKPRTTRSKVKNLWDSLLEHVDGDTIEHAVRRILETKTADETLQVLESHASLSV